MNELYHDPQQPDEQATRVMSPVSVPEGERPPRRRRTERFAGLIDEADSSRPDDAAPADAPVQEAIPAPTAPESASPWKRENPDLSSFAGMRVPPRPQAPSQGVPRPAALSGQPPRRSQEEQPTRQTPVVRRPVDAEGYGQPLQQLGMKEPARVRRPEQTSDTPRRVRTPETERVAYDASAVPDEEAHGGSALVAVIIVLLVIAALILGLLMIPEDDTGFLGSMKRTVTEPVRNLLAIAEDEDKIVPARADSFTTTISQATSPYKVVFHMVTSSSVKAVRVVDDFGSVLPTITTLSTPSSESTIVWMFEMTTEEDFSGTVHAQMQDNTTWVDTGLTQTLALGTPYPTGTANIPVSSLTPATEKPTATPASSDPPAELPVAVLPTDEADSTDAPTAAPDVEETTPTTAPTEAPTATPTLAVTATPTLMPTATPTAEPTEAPTPTPEPTEAPTPTPEPTPVATPRLEAVADESADPALISTQTIHKDGKKVTSYEREKPIDMPAGDDYLTKPFGVTTFRGNAFRQNAAVRTVDSAESLSLLWTVEAGSIAGSSRTYYGIGWSGQPVIVRWPPEIRMGMNVNADRKDQKNLTEVIIAGLDGKIYFLDLLDGTATRAAINFGYPMRATPSVHPLSYPMLTFGQYARKLKSGTSKKIGLYYYSLIDQKQLRLIDGLDSKYKRTYASSQSVVGSFDTSALIDRNTDTLIAVGTNGLLYTETLSMRVIGSSDGSGIVYEFNDPSQSVTLMSHTKKQDASLAAVESSLAMYGSYAYYADLDGILRCVDTTTMTTVWAVNTGDSVRAAIALDLEEGEDTNTLWLYTANLVNTKRTKGDVTIRRYNAMTGEEDWAFAIHCAEGKKKDVTFNDTVIPGAMASPVIGQNGLSDLVYFTLSSVSATGAKALDESSALSGVLIAMDKATGEVVWHKTMDAYCYSSPVAVYDADGRGWIIQACSNGTLYLLDGLTGETINTLSVSGVIEASPAVFGDTLVIGTTGKGTSYIYGIKIN